MYSVLVLSKNHPQYHQDDKTGLQSTSHFDVGIVLEESS
jgi:hypothetical protein